MNELIDIPLSDILKIGTPTILGIIGTITSYYKGKKSKIVEIRITKGFECAEKISLLMHSINERITYLIEFYKRNYSSQEYEPENVGNFEERIDTLFEHEKNLIDDLEKEKSELTQHRKKLISLPLITSIN